MTIARRSPGVSAANVLAVERLSVVAIRSDFLVPLRLPSSGRCDLATSTSPHHHTFNDTFTSPNITRSAQSASHCAFFFVVPDFGPLTLATRELSTYCNIFYQPWLHYTNIDTVLLRQGTAYLNSFRLLGTQTTRLTCPSSHTTPQEVLLHSAYGRQLLLTVNSRSRASARRYCHAHPSSFCSTRARVVVRERRRIS